MGNRQVKRISSTFPIWWFQYHPDDALSDATTVCHGNGPYRYCQIGFFIFEEEVPHILNSKLDGDNCVTFERGHVYIPIVVQMDAFSLGSVPFHHRRLRLASPSALISFALWN